MSKYFFFLFVFESFTLSFFDDFLLFSCLLLFSPLSFFCANILEKIEPKGIAAPVIFGFSSSISSSFSSLSKSPKVIAPSIFSKLFKSRFSAKSLNILSNCLFISAKFILSFDKISCCFAKTSVASIPFFLAQS